MDTEQRNETSVSATTEQIGGIVPGVASGQELDSRRRH
jgi:hypothetical protein